jgi:hypothetical protein
MMRHAWVGIALVILASPIAADEKAKTPLDKMKKLAGEWVAVGEDGKPTDKVITKFKVISAGSAVQETIHPGDAMEMVSVYHLDGKDLIMTHYCAMGNQPKMKLDSTGKANEMKFAFAGGTNLDAAKDMHMHEGSITWIDDDTIQWSWVGYMDGKPVKDHHISLKLVRKK